MLKKYLVKSAFSEKNNKEILKTLLITSLSMCQVLVDLYHRKKIQHVYYLLNAHSKIRILLC